MKRLIFILVAAFAITLLVGCSSEERPAPKVTVTDASMLEEAERLLKEAETLVDSVPDPAPEGSVTEGIYLVGEDIPAGTYKTDGPTSDGEFDSCYFERAKDDSGRIEAIIDNDNLSGPGRFTVGDGQVLTLNGSCVWTKI